MERVAATERRLLCSVRESSRCRDARLDPRRDSPAHRPRTRDSDERVRRPNFGVQFHATGATTPTRSASRSRQARCRGASSGSASTWDGLRSGELAQLVHSVSRRPSRLDREPGSERAGINVLGMLWRTPDWANGGAGTPNAAQRSRDYGRSLAGPRSTSRVASRRGKCGTSDLDYSSTDPRGLREALKASYSQFKAGDTEREGRARRTFCTTTPDGCEGLRRGAHRATSTSWHDPYPGVATRPGEARRRHDTGRCRTSRRCAT